jgi:hypothetical protein
MAIDPRTSLVAHGKRSGLICVSMHLLSAHERKLTGLARGIRAAIVMPLLFALSFVVIRQPVMAGFAVFGAFAHLVMVDYNVDAAARSDASRDTNRPGRDPDRTWNAFLAEPLARGGGCDNSRIASKVPGSKIGREKPGSVTSRFAHGVHASSRSPYAIRLAVSPAFWLADSRTGGASPIAVALDFNSSGHIGWTARCRLLRSSWRHFCRSGDGNCRVNGTRREA